MKAILPKLLKETMILRAFGFLKIPLLAWVKPSVVELTDDTCAVKIPLTRRSRNHLKSMYFGALAAGADCAGGLIAMREIQRSGKDVSLVFKDFKADFKRRAMGDVIFRCTEGKEIRELVDKAISTGQRVEMPVSISAIVASQNETVVAEFILTLSLKMKRNS